jgi:thiamine-monophosphate kinase
VISLKSLAFVHSPNNLFIDPIDIPTMAKQLREIGEREAIEHIRKILDQGDFPLGLTDDCAAIEMGKNYLLVSTDMINERTHMPVGMTAYDMGWHVIAVNLSDIASKGGEPLGVEVAR